MGQITVTTNGSFGQKTRQFQAIANGHADAVAQAIEYLAAELLPDSIAQDHDAHDQGAKPKEGFKRNT